MVPPGATGLEDGLDHADRSALDGPDAAQGRVHHDQVARAQAQVTQVLRERCRGPGREGPCG